MGTIVLVIIVNFLVETCAGMTGVAGFLLPMFYAGFLNMDPVEGLALSFAAFMVAGVLGCPAYRKTGDLPFRPCIALLAGSAIGAAAGTGIGLVLPPKVLSVILYLVVLASGISVLVRMRADRDRLAQGPAAVAKASRFPSKPALFVIGVLTAVICAASGAGGPILVIPILMLLGVGARKAVAMAILDSVVIAIPATIGYFAGGDLSPQVWMMLPGAVIASSAGMVVGSMNAHRINARLLKTIVAVGAIGISAVKLLGIA